VFQYHLYTIEIYWHNPNFLGLKPKSKSRKTVRWERAA